MARRPRLNDGDLLRAWHALAAHERDSVALALQYFGRAAPEVPPADEEIAADTDQPLVAPRLEPPEPPLPAVAVEQQVFWRITEIQHEPSEEDPHPVESVDDAVFCSPPDAAPPPREVPLMASRAVMARLRRHLVRGVETDRLDVLAAVRWIADGRPLHRLPPTRQARLPGAVQVVIEASATLGPLRHDFIPVLDRLGRWLGPRRRLLRADGSPHWIRDVRGRPAEIRTDGSPVVLLGDAGLLAQAGEAAMERWVQRGQALMQAGQRPLLLLPASVQRVAPEVARVFDVVAMEGDTAAAPVAMPAEALEDPVRGLRAAIFGNTYVRPGLLRRLRQAVRPWYPWLDAAAEAQLWNDAGVVSNINACALSTEQRPAAEADFAAWPAALREAVIEVHLAELASMSPLVRAEYVLWVSRHVPAGTRLRPVLDEAVLATEWLMAQAGARLQAGDDRMARELEAHLLDFGERSAPLLAQGSEAVQRAWVMAWRRSAQPRDEAHLPAGLRLERLGGLMRPMLGTQALELRVQQCGQGVEVRVDLAEAGGVTGAALHRTEGVPLWQVDGAEVRRVGDRVERSSRAGFEVRLGTDRVRVESFVRPEWAESIEFDQDRWAGRTVEGRELIWVPRQRVEVVGGVGASGFVIPNGAWRSVRGSHQIVKPPWAIRFGADEFGEWDEFEVRGVTQRMRWIAPGEFLMGSPEEEIDRFNDERQHPVLITKGYWLADTACTQELWEVVMGENPSNFKDNLQNPVERVSWNDITQKFLPRLNKLVPGLNLTLPTEAQWEYACRAGTQTRYSFGDEINQEQVNFDGKRGKTVPVRELPANPWGLHQMQGNVWEWCLDELAAYPEGTSIDPVFHQDKKEEGSRRVLRGGCWLSDGGLCRSARRLAFVPGLRDRFIGLRLARVAEQPGAGWTEQPNESRSWTKTASTLWSNLSMGFGLRNKKDKK
ncbi:formylglycine-generating enzyme family protein [Sphaerotilus sp.]|uniref:formylglycine-generating enzyme family protein n=1 Tax=Sphaerotilus sp. TaxID=2093942 RepID=UPI002ACDAF3D|nr:formylglycine-generating enzyme family protein [Sphaerotilus sp.]MDZ7858360.1 formylglycine-generating enzyme family protein [Sphaerotilus sp.]